MSKSACAPAPSKSFAPFSSQLSGESRWFPLAPIAAATLAVSTLAPATSWAQQADSTHRPGHRVAVIDVGYIFRNLPAIKAQVSKVEAELKEFEADLEQKREALKQAAAQLQALKFGTDDYNRQEEQVAKMESQLRLDMGRTHKGLRDAEAKIYYENYRRIAQAVKTIAIHNDIKLVLRFNSEEMDSEHNASVARGVMKNVVYQDGTIDMTDTVMRYLQQQAE